MATLALIRRIVPSMTVMPDVPAKPFAATAAVSGHLDTRTAGTEVADELYEGLGARPDLVLVFASFHHRAALADTVASIRRTLDPRDILAVTTEASIGPARELEGVAGFSAMAMNMPGVRVRSWLSPPEDPVIPGDLDGAADLLGLDDAFRAAIMIAEPFTIPIARLLPTLTSCGGPGRPVPIVGGMASGASQPGQNVLILNDHVMDGGAIGVSLSGRVHLDTVLSQGCRPIGTPLVITQAESNMILELGGDPALDVVRELMNTLEDPDRVLMSQGILLGHLIDETKRPVGRGDFLVRTLLGMDQNRDAILSAERLRPGQTVQFHVRDAQTAHEDLQLLLDAQMLQAPPFAGLLFSCNGRGQRLFGEANHDIGIISERFDGMPLAGFFAAGEIGPVSGQSFVHGHTAALALLRGR